MTTNQIQQGDSASSATPGPWSEPCTFGLSKFEVQGDGKKVAVFERLEDARLGSAAPELLAVVRQCEGWIVQQMLDNGCPPERLEQPPEGSHLFNARAAIARATGGQV